MKDKPWVASALKKSSRVKNSLYKKWLKTKSKISEDRYKNYRKVYKKTAREAELSYYKELFDCRKYSTKKLWANLSKVCSFKKCNTSKSIRKLVINNKTSATAYRRSPARAAVLLLGPVYAGRRRPAAGAGAGRRRRPAGRRRPLHAGIYQRGSRHIG